MKTIILAQPGMGKTYMHEEDPVFSYDLDFGILSTRVFGVAACEDSQELTSFYPALYSVVNTMFTHKDTIFCNNPDFVSSYSEFFPEVRVILFVHNSPQAWLESIRRRGDGGTPFEQMLDKHKDEWYASWCSTAYHNSRWVAIKAQEGEHLADLFKNPGLLDYMNGDNSVFEPLVTRYIARHKSDLALINVTLDRIHSLAYKILRDRYMMMSDGNMYDMLFSEPVACASYAVDETVEDVISHVSSL